MGLGTNLQRKKVAVAKQWPYIVTEAMAQTLALSASSPKNLQTSPNWRLTAGQLLEGWEAACFPGNTLDSRKEEISKLLLLRI